MARPQKRTGPCCAPFDGAHDPSCTRLVAIRDQGQQVVLLQPNALSKPDELTACLHHKGTTTGRSAADDCASAAAQFDEVLLLEQLVAAQNGVHVDIQGASQRSGGRQPFSFVELAFSQRPAYRGGDLPCQSLGSAS